MAIIILTSRAVCIMDLAAPRAIETTRATTTTRESTIEGGPEEMTGTEVDIEATEADIEGATTIITDLIEVDTTATKEDETLQIII